MPILGVMPTPTAAPVTSSDLVLTGWLDLATSSVLLRVDFTQRSGTAAVRTVTVQRSDGTVVRSLDAQFAPPGVGYGIDHEPPLGGTVTYTAVGTTAAGTTVTSTVVNILVPAAAGVTWLKSIRNPAASCRMVVETYPDFSRSIAQTVLTPLGAAYPMVGSDVRQARTGSLSVLTSSRAERERLDALLDDPGPYLLQCSPAADEADRFVTVGATSVGRPSRIASDPWRLWTLPLTEVARPDTFGWDVIIPGDTLLDLPADATATSWTTPNRLVDLGPS